MDLLSSIRKQGSRGGVDFKWDDVQTSAHRENYLGHSLMAPVGRWQKGKDLSWYAKGDDEASGSNETAEERRVRERKEEIRKIKEAEEDALARALGLPVTPRNGGEGTGANDIDIGEMRRVIKETEDGDDEIDEVGKNAGFGNFVGKGDAGVEKQQGHGHGDLNSQQGGLLGKAGKKDKHDRSRRKERGDRRSRSRSRERRHRKHRQRSRSPEPHRLRDEEDSRRSRRHRSRSAERGHRHRSRSAEPHRSRKDERERRRSRSPNPRGRPRRWEKDEERERERERERRR